ncbi:hypothetical protein MHU86_211 [Fragilaria crotonensis]|nr:hypothetical protein MHU86_211 [Fragilaria crotonensis]
MAKTLNMVNTSRSQHSMNDHDDEEDGYQPGSRVYAWNQSTTSWGNFPGLKTLGHVAPLCNEGSDDEHDVEDMFSIFSWSSVVAKDQFSKDYDRAKESSIEEEPLTYSVDIVDRSASTTAETADGSGGHRRSRRRASMGGSRPYSKSPGDITRRERFHRSRSKDTNRSSDSLSGNEEPRKRRKSRSRRKHSSRDPESGDDEARMLRKSRSTRKSSHSTSYSAPDGGVDVDEPARTHRRVQRRASMPLLMNPDTTYDEPERQASQKSSYSTPYAAPEVDVEMEEPPRAHRRAQRRASMPLMTNPDTANDEPEPQAKSRRSLLDPETPARRSVRSKRRESMSSTMSRTNELPKPRPVDMRLFPQALPFLEGLAPKTPETPSRSGRMLRRSSMPTSMSYTDNLPKSRPLDASHMSPNSALNVPVDDRYSDSERRLAGGGGGHSSSRMKRRGSSGMSYDEVPVTPGGRDRPEGTRQIRRKSNEHHDFQSNDDDDVTMVASSRSRRRGSPTHDEMPSSPSGVEPRTPLRRSGRMSRRSSM